MASYRFVVCCFSGELSGLLVDIGIGMFMTPRCAALCLAVLSISGHASFARTKLTQEEVKSCKGAMAERTRLNTVQRRQLLLKDPKEELKRLDSTQLKDLRRLIELDEQVMFKCRLVAHPDLKKKKPGKVQSLTGRKISMAPPDLPARNPKLLQLQAGQSEQLPLPVRKPKSTSG